METSAIYRDEGLMLASVARIAWKVPEFRLVLGGLSDGYQVLPHEAVAGYVRHVEGRPELQQRLVDAVEDELALWASDEIDTPMSEVKCPLWRLFADTIVGMLPPHVEPRRADMPDNPVYGPFRRSFVALRERGISLVRGEVSLTPYPLAASMRFVWLQVEPFRRTADDARERNTGD